MAFEARITAKDLETLKRRCLEFPDISHDDRAKLLTKEFPNFTEFTLRNYSRICLGSSEKVFTMFLEEKVKLGVLLELCTWKKEDQDYIIDEYIEQKFTPETLRKIRRYRKENGWSYDECIGRATGKIEKNMPRKNEVRKSLDNLLSEIANKGARWRAMVTQAIEMVGEEEATAGVHEALFAKVILLREVIGNQYDFVNNRLNRYINLIRKRFQNDGSSPGMVEGTLEGEDHAVDSGADQGRVDREEGDPGKDGPAVPDPSGQSEG